jgi:methanogenic corrinoid protein MtbC1
MLVRQNGKRPRSISRSTQKDPTDLEVTELVRLLMAHDSSVASAYVDALRQRGVQPPAVCLKLLAPAARRLGSLWDEDLCSFTQVTLGLCRLHQVLHGLCADQAAVPQDPDGMAGQRTLLVGMPGDQHTFGVLMLGQLLRRVGWDVWNEFPDSQGALLDLVKDTSFRIVGLSIGSDRQVEELSGLIRAVRRASRYRKVSIMLGGPLVQLNPALAAAMGADATPASGDDAIRWAQSLVAPASGSVRSG